MTIFLSTTYLCRTGYRSWHSGWLRGEHFVDRIPVKARFSAPGQTGPGAHPVTCTLYTLSLSALKQQGRGVDRSPPSKVKVKERVQLYIYSRSEPS